MLAGLNGKRRLPATLGVLGVLLCGLGACGDGTLAGDAPGGSLALDVTPVSVVPGGEVTVAGGPCPDRGFPEDRRWEVRIRTDLPDPASPWQARRYSPGEREAEVFDTLGAFPGRVDVNMAVAGEWRTRFRMPAASSPGPYKLTALCTTGQIVDGAVFYEARTIDVVGDHAPEVGGDGMP